MRTSENIEQIIETAKLRYSGRMQVFYLLKQRGLSVETVDNHEEFSRARSLIRGIQFPALTNIQKDVFADQLVKMGYGEPSTMDVFTESVYDNDFDTL